MAWTTPMTATANSAWTSSQWNAHVRDNLLETMPGKATAAGRWFVASAANAIAERAISASTVLTLQTTSSTSYTDLATVGPAVTVTTGTQALVFYSAEMGNSAANDDANVSYAISGATTVAASDDWRLLLDGVAASNNNRFGMCNLHTGLTAGSNTFTLKYRIGNAANTGSFQRRELIVIAF